MNKSRFQIFLVIALLALLGVSAVLQYVWLGQISEAERDRLTRRLQTDTERFSTDFNREIQSAYFNFQTDDALWQSKNWAQFNERYDLWREKSAYPKLITDFYYFENKPAAGLLRYDAEKREFVEANWTNELQNLRTNAADREKSQPFNETAFALVSAVYEEPKNFERVAIRKIKTSADNENISAVPTKIDLPEQTGFLIIKLDEAVVKNQILADLAKKHFPEGNFNLAVVGANDQTIFQTNAVTAADSSVKLFDLTPDNLLFFTKPDVLPRVANAESKGVVINRKIQTSSISSIRAENQSADKLPPNEMHKTFQLEVKTDEKPRTIIQTTNVSAGGIWRLDVQHSAGSLEQFIASTRRQNLGIGFGILSLLAVSIVLVFVSAHRAKVFARRQIDFVSSVSHEFRTPLAVIYSAGENLADGVAKEEKQVLRYGDLIKAEGKKLSKMVEQILEFAGANAGRKKYDFREQSVEKIVENALSECRSLIDEKGFTVEKQIAANLPLVKADANALSRAIQNLIVNSLKYSDGEKFIKISANNGGGNIKIVVEDKGIGIGKADLKHIFEPFFRAKTVIDEQISGNGLGLSLVRETVEKHGGKVLAQSEIGKGSSFTIELPLNEK